LTESTRVEDLKPGLRNSNPVRVDSNRVNPNRVRSNRVGLDRVDSNRAE
jgi:hypothetical protein